MIAKLERVPTQEWDIPPTIKYGSIFILRNQDLNFLDPRIHRSYNIGEIKKKTVMEVKEKEWTSQKQYAPHFFYIWGHNYHTINNITNRLEKTTAIDTLSLNNFTRQNVVNISFPSVFSPFHKKELQYRNADYS